MDMVTERCKAYWREQVFALLHTLCQNTVEITADQLVVQYTQDSARGDLALPLFPFARYAADSPQQLAAELERLLNGDERVAINGRAEAAGGYLNIHLNRADIMRQIFAVSVADGVRGGGADGATGSMEAVSLVSSPLAGQKVCVEFSSPNTNKPLHLGHLRNNVIGASIARILQYCGVKVTRINLINDRGVHICKSMAAYMRFGERRTPADLGVRPDVFVGDYYVRFAEWEREDAGAIDVARQLLRQWEAGDAGVRRLWEQMRQWVLDGIGETYRRTGIVFDLHQYESDTYLHGKEIVRQGLDDGVFRRAEDGSVEIDLSDAGLDVKTLLRNDGTAIYVTQDLGTVVQRHRDLQFDRLIYVVANEQEYHFKVLFEIVSRLKLSFAAQLFHRSYGIVQLPDGKMKSREGTVVDADDLINEVRSVVAREMESENRYRKQYTTEERQAIAEKIAISSIHYWLVKFDPRTNITFDTKQSISFSGNSGAYILYTIARIHHLLLHASEQRGASGAEASAEVSARGATDADVHAAVGDPVSLLAEELEWQLVFLIAQFPEVVLEAARSYTPFPIAQYLYRLAQTFSRYYHDIPIAVVDDPALKAARLGLVTRLLAVLEQCCSFLMMPTVEDM